MYLPFIWRCGWLAGVHRLLQISIGLWYEPVFDAQASQLMFSFSGRVRGLSDLVSWCPLT